MHEDPAGNAAAPLRLAIGIPTCGRPSMIAETLRDIAQQTRQPDRVLVCATNQADVEIHEGVPAGVEILFAPIRAPAPAQRHTGQAG